MSHHPSPHPSFIFHVPPEVRVPEAGRHGTALPVPPGSAPGHPLGGQGATEGETRAAHVAVRAPL